MSAFHAVTDSFNQLNLAIAQDASLARVCRLGRERLADLDEDERVRFDFLLLGVFRVFETLYFQHKHGTGDPALWSAETNTLVSLLGAPGTREWWTSNPLSHARVPALRGARHPEAGVRGGQRLAERMESPRGRTPGAAIRRRSPGRARAAARLAAAPGGRNRPTIRAHPGTVKMRGTLRPAGGRTLRLLPGAPARRSPLAPHLVHPFAFLIPPHDRSRRSRPFQIRDGAAMLEVISALARSGYEYAGLLLNYPPRPDEDVGTVLKIPVSAGPGDLILTTTRPPVHPQQENNEKKRVDLAQTDLEDLVIRAWNPYFKLLIRPEMELAYEVQDDLLPGYEDRRHIAFYQLEGSRYQDLGTRRYVGRPSTAAFLLRIRELWPGGPGYLGVYGMDGTTTLVWAYLLRTRHRALLEEPGFAMAELTMGEIPSRTGDLGFVQGWQAKIILHRRL
jgi:hypothetical protein